MLKLLKNFFGANNKDSTPSEWTDESWNADSYEKMLATAAPLAIAGGFGDDAGGGLFGGIFNNGSGAVDTGAVFDTDNGASLFNTNEPAFNIDGTPMMGSVDIHGNPYGVTGAHSGFDSHSHFDSGSSWSSSSDSFSSFDSGWSSDNHF